MAKSQETFSKKEKEKKKVQKRKEKEEKKALRQANSDKGKALEEMFAYVDENGNISSTPPDPKKKKVINSEDISVSVQRQEQMDDADEKRTGVVTFFNDAKGYGFIKDSRTQESLFVHANSLKTPIKDNDRVAFKVEKGPKGLNAIEVVLV